MMDSIEYDCPDGCCPKCDCEVCMDVQELPNIIIRYICPHCGYFEDFDDSPFVGPIPPIIPPYDDLATSSLGFIIEALRIPNWVWRGDK